MAPTLNELIQMRLRPANGVGISIEGYGIKRRIDPGVHELMGSSETPNAQELLEFVKDSAALAVVIGLNGDKREPYTVAESAEVDRDCADVGQVEEKRPAVVFDAAMGERIADALLDPAHPAQYLFSVLMPRDRQDPLQLLVPLSCQNILEFTGSKGKAREGTQEHQAMFERAKVAINHSGGMEKPFTIRRHPVLEASEKIAQVTAKLGLGARCSRRLGSPPIGLIRKGSEEAVSPGKFGKAVDDEDFTLPDLVLSKRL